MQPLDAQTGQTLWEHGYPAIVKKKDIDETHMKYGLGPQSTPLLVRNHLYTIGWTGRMHCLDKKNGRVVWLHDLIEEFGGTVMGRGYSCSPIHYKDKVIVPVGGAGHAIMALDQRTGRDDLV